MAAATTIALVGLGAAAAGTVYSGVQQGRAAKATQRSAALDRQRMNLQNARERREAVRQSRLASAQAEMAASNQGVQGSSSAQGGQASIVSQLSSNLSFLDRFNTLSDQASQQIGYANKFQQKAQTGQAISNLGWQVFSNSSTLSDMWKGTNG